MGRRSSHTPEQLRELIIEAATELIAENGLQGLSAREIARRIEYSPGTIYNVFRDIDELLFTIEHRMLDTLTARLASVADAGEPLERLCAMAATYLAFSLERPQLWNLLMEHTQKPGVELPPDFKCRLDGLIGEIGRVIDGLDVGLDDETQKRRATAVIWAGLHGISTLATAQKLPHVTPADAAVLVDDLVRTYVAGLQKSAAAKPKRRRA